MAEVSKINVAGFVFPPEVQPPGSSSSLFLAGAGERGLEIGGKFIVFTAIGVYLESAAIESLAGKWKGKSGDELAASPDFFRDIFTGSFDKLTNVTMVLPLSGQQYSEKVTENCIKYLQATGAYSEAEAEATEKFKESLKDENFPPGGSLLFTHSSSGSLTISFLKESSAPLREVAVIENGALSEAILESIIGEHGVSPTAKKSLAHRISGHLNEPQVLKEEEKLVMEPAYLTVQQ